MIVAVGGWQGQGHPWHYKIVWSRSELSEVMQPSARGRRGGSVMSRPGLRFTSNYHKRDQGKLSSSQAKQKVSTLKQIASTPWQQGQSPKPGPSWRSSPKRTLYVLQSSWCGGTCSELMGDMKRKSFRRHKELRYVSSDAPEHKVPEDCRDAWCVWDSPTSHCGFSVGQVVSRRTYLNIK